MEISVNKAVFVLAACGVMFLVSTLISMYVAKRLHEINEARIRILNAEIAHMRGEVLAAKFRLAKVDAQVNIAAVKAHAAYQGYERSIT